MRIKINYEVSEDCSYEVIRVTKNEVVIAEISTSSDSPEDNNLSRMGVMGQIESLISEIDPDIEIEVVKVPTETSRDGEITK